MCSVWCVGVLGLELFGLFFFSFGLSPFVSEKSNVQRLKGLVTLKANKIDFLFFLLHLFSRRNS